MSHNEELMENGGFVAIYHRSNSAEKLVVEEDGDEDGADDDQVELENEELEEEEYEFVEVSPKHVYFVTDPGLSSWSDSEGAFEETTALGSFRGSVKRLVEHFGVRIFSLLLVLLDVIIVIVDLATSGESERVLEVISIVIVTYFLLEVGLRIFALGSFFFRRWLEVLDMVVIVVSFILTIVFSALTLENQKFAKLVVAARFIRVLLFIRIVTGKDQVERATRRMISQNKRRYQKDGFDLDLTYVTERVIAMSFPSSGKHKMYGNPISEVVRFLDTKHDDCYRVYNLCSERSYDPGLFHNRVERILIDDHNVPRLSQLLYFCHNVKEWLDKDAKNVIAVHCKGGKGRTGTAVCAWLIASGQFEKAAHSLDYFGVRRTDYTVGKQFQGVQTPSQSRYVGYLEQVFKRMNGRLPRAVSLKLKAIKIDGIGSVGSGNGKDLRFEIIINGSPIYQVELMNARPGQVQHFQELDKVMVSLNEAESPPLTGDIKMKFYSTHSDTPKGYDNCAFFFWFHTSFIENCRLFLRREELDNPHKSKSWNVYKEHFAVDLTFMRL